MQISFLLSICCVLFWSEEARADGDNEVKRGAFPFMAVVYYPDEAVVDATGARFQRAAVLIKPKWLLSSSIDHSVLDNVPLGFPRKTLLAKAGAVNLDVNYTFNEDEDEQEREIIQIVRPNIHNVESWWFTDITLLQTLLPFKMTSAVAVTTINPKKEYTDKNCNILVYAKKYGNATEEKVLMQLGVELLPASIDNCGSQFSDTTMTCGLDSDDTKNALFDADFCQGNSGGPLLCEGEVMGLQTYIENNCKQPHLYQLLSTWHGFINCGVEEQCNKNENCNVCTVTNKDLPPPVTETTTAFTLLPNISDISSSNAVATETIADEIDTLKPQFDNHTVENQNTTTVKEPRVPTVVEATEEPHTDAIEMPTAPLESLPRRFNAYDGTTESDNGSRSEHPELQTIPVNTTAFINLPELLTRQEDTTTHKTDTTAYQTHRFIDTEKPTKVLEQKISPPGEFPTTLTDGPTEDLHQPTDSQGPHTTAEAERTITQSEETDIKTTTEKSTTHSEIPFSKPWPVERQDIETRKKLEQSEDAVRTTKVEAQRAPPEKRARPPAYVAHSSDTSLAAKPKHSSHIMILFPLSLALLL